MNIVYLIGNGFNINLKLQTRYSDFYKEFDKQSFTNKGTELLKSEIKSNTKDWSDFEKKFGDFTSQFIDKDKDNVKEFNATYKDVVTSLSKYLLEIEDSFNHEKIDEDKFIYDIINPEEHLLLKDQREIMTFKKIMENNPVKINFITYNYTTIIEKIFGKSFSIDLGLTRQKKRILIEDIKHIHGYLDKRMIIGVNDKSQISNQDFKNQDAISYNLIKSITNDISKELVKEDCINKINGAQLIYIFGSSLGDTDLMWWELILEKLKTNCRLIIFHRDNDTNPLFPSENTTIENQVKVDFLNKSKLTVAEKEDIEDKMFVVVNSEMFDIQIE